MFRREAEEHNYMDNPVDKAEDQEQASRLLELALGKLPESQRTAFILSKHDDLQNTEVAKIMDTTVSAVDSMLHRAKQSMQKTIRKNSRTQ